MLAAPTINAGADGQPAYVGVVALFAVHVADATEHDGNQGYGLAERAGNECRDGIQQPLAGDIGRALEQQEIKNVDGELRE